MVRAVAKSILAVGLGCALASPVQGQAVSRATTLLRAGEYQEALSILEESAGRQDSSVGMKGAYARALMEVGR